MDKKTLEDLPLISVLEQKNLEEYPAQGVDDYWKNIYSFYPDFNFNIQPDKPLNVFEKIFCNEDEVDEYDEEETTDSDNESQDEGIDFEEQPVASPNMLPTMIEEMNLEIRKNLLAIDAHVQNDLDVHKDPNIEEPAGTSQLNVKHVVDKIIDDVIQDFGLKNQGAFLEVPKTDLMNSSGMNHLEICEEPIEEILNWSASLSKEIKDKISDQELQDFMIENKIRLSDLQRVEFNGDNCVVVEPNDNEELKTSESEVSSEKSEAWNVKYLADPMTDHVVEIILEEIMKEVLTMPAPLVQFVYSKDSLILEWYMPKYTKEWVVYYEVWLGEEVEAGKPHLLWKKYVETKTRKMECEKSRLPQGRHEYFAVRAVGRDALLGKTSLPLKVPCEMSKGHCSIS